MIQNVIHEKEDKKVKRKTKGGNLQSLVRVCTKSLRLAEHNSEILNN